MVILMKLTLFLRLYQNLKLLLVIGHITQFRYVSSDIVSHQNGLLLGIHDIKETLYYSGNIPIKKSYELVKDTNHLYNICLNNADGNTATLNEDLKTMSDKAEEFIQSKEVWDRKELITSIENIVAHKGKFVCLLAGKSTGKSLVLSNLETRLPGKFFKVDLRNDPDILRGLLWTLRDRQMADYKDSTKQFAADMASKVLGKFFGALGAFTDILGFFGIILTEEVFKIILNIALSKRDPQGLQSLMNNLVKHLGAITLVIDEANIAFTITDKTSTDKIEATKEALALFTHLTKQENKLNVILVSSEHVFPYRLLHPELNFNLNNFNGYIYAGEVPPNDMYELLTMKWKIEPNVALALINMYGGHIYDIKEALSRLYLEKEICFQFFDPNLSSNVLKCLIWKFKKKDNARMRETLRQLAVTGFVPLENRDDPVARVISANNVGGVVMSYGKVIGLRPEVWQQTKFKFGIVPSKQSMRLVIAEMLEE